ncbi:YisL family protein [Bacillus manliponensis]|uniref:YisL family protein n=1 Tax=Bacillus manliponensis TaxID=574376 RepID=UPI003518864C
MVHMHITAWVLGLLLFFVAYSMYTAGRKGKGIHMGLRLVYILIIISGFMLYQGIMEYATSKMHMMYGLKMLVGVLVIGTMEMVLVRTSKKKSTGVVWTLFILALVVVLYLGLHLPIGFKPFA